MAPNRSLLPIDVSFHWLLLDFGNLSFAGSSNMVTGETKSFFSFAKSVSVLASLLYCDVCMFYAPPSKDYFACLQFAPLIVSAACSPAQGRTKTWFTNETQGCFVLISTESGFSAFNHSSKMNLAIVHFICPTQQPAFYSGHILIRSPFY